MSRPSIIAPIYKSLVRAVTDMIETIQGEGLHGPMQYHNWESRGEENDLAKITLVGLDGFSFDENEGLWLVRVALAVSSFRDFNLLDEIELLDRIQQIMGQGEKIRLLEMVNGDQVSELMITEFKVLPMAQSEIRNYRTIGLSLSRTEITRP